MKTWKKTLRKNYGTFEEWKSYSEMYGLTARLGFDSAEQAWKENPRIGGSVHPKDFGLVK